LHVYLQRHPRDQWQSYVSGERPYFMPLTIAIATLRAPYAAQLSSILDRPLPSKPSLFGRFRRRSVRRILRAARRFDRKLDDADRYRIFYADWLRAAREAECHCDLTIDINRISHDRRARREIETTFSIRLDDCQIKEYQEHRLPPFSMELIERQVHALFEDVSARRPSRLSPLAKAA
jgi:hypothetical protein